MLVNHINIMDSAGKVFCKKLNGIVQLDFDICCSCEMFNGSAQGEGVECLWEDKRTTQALLRIDIPELELEWLEGVSKRPYKERFSQNEKSFNNLLDKIHKKMQEDENS